MVSSPTGPATSLAADNLLNSCSVVGAAAKLLRRNWEELSDQDRAAVLEGLGRHAEHLAAGLKQLVRLGDRDRIDALESAAAISRDRIEALEASALDSEAASLVSDARILELAAQVERLLAARDQAAVIDQAKSELMRVMHIGEDAAFAVLVAASQRENLDLYSFAERIAARHDESSPS